MFCEFAVRRRISHNQKRILTENLVQYGLGKAQRKMRTKRHVLVGSINNYERFLAEGTLLTSNSKKSHRNYTREDDRPATRLARFLNRVPQDGGISIDASDDIDLGRLPENDHMSGELPDNATESRVGEFTEDEHTEYTSTRDGHIMGHEQVMGHEHDMGNEQDTSPSEDTIVRNKAKKSTHEAPVHSKRPKRVDINIPVPQDTVSEKINDIEINDRNPYARQGNLPTLVGEQLSLEKAGDRLSRRSNISVDELPTGYPRTRNNNQEAGLLSANIRRLFSDHPRGVYALQVSMTRHPTAFLLDTTYDC